MSSLSGTAQSEQHRRRPEKVGSRRDGIGVIYWSYMSNVFELRSVLNLMFSKENEMVRRSRAAALLKGVLTLLTLAGLAMPAAFATPALPSAAVASAAVRSALAPKAVPAPVKAKVVARPVSAATVRAQGVTRAASAPVVRSSGRSAVVHSTAYNSAPNQTDSSPYVTATGTRVRSGVVALSRDLLARFPYGTRITIEDLSGRYSSVLRGRVFVVEDTMHPRIGNTVDVWMGSRREAMAWGTRNIRITAVR